MGLDDDVGVIRPPPEIRAVVDKTAQFVARNGVEFEQKIAEKQQGNAKFNFLRDSDPYHAYYVQQVELYRQGKEPQQQEGVSSSSASGQETQTKAQEQTTHEGGKTEETTASKDSNKNKLSSKVAVITPYLQARKKIPGGGETPETPPSYQFLPERPAGVSPAKMETIKLTAQYTAVSGRSFLNSLSTKEQNNSEFDFLKPNSQLFSCFTSLVEMYTKILKPSNEQKEKLADSAQRKFSVFERSAWRAEWRRVEEDRKARERAEQEGEQLAMADIDWHDFVVVDTIDFNDDDEGLPAPSAQPAPRKHEVDISAKPSGPTQSSTQKEEDVMDTDSDESDQDDTQMGGPDDDDENLNVVPEDSYQPKVTQQKPSAPQVVDPHTGKEMSVHNLNENLRIQYMDPKYREETKRALEKHTTTNYLGGEDVAENLQRLAARRSDIFGEETVKARARAPQEQANAHPQAVWDGKVMSAQALQEAKRLAAQRQQQQEAASQREVVDQPSTVVGPAAPPPGKRQRKEEY